ncbi:MAG: 16S rRNA (adenine(1518)-N(6)/adenine(1519)-N(6))-dimethyltransferase RsmA [Gemmatimonadales bacterium]
MKVPPSRTAEERQGPLRSRRRSGSVVSGAGSAPEGRPAPNRRLGQHFLLDSNLTGKIARLAAVAAGETVLEVGPGPGGLTRALLETGARVIAVEKDRRFAPLLEALGEEFPGQLALVFADALAADEAALIAAHREGAGTIQIIANLPYNIASPLLVKWLTGRVRPTAMTLMFQKEVARRVCAPAGVGDYGRLSVIAQAVMAPTIVMDIPARAFTPPPKVDSAVVRLIPLAERPSDALLAALQDVTRAAFGQRRKMLRSSLRSMGGEALCAAVGVDATDRAEDVGVAGFLALARERLGRPP